MKVILLADVKGTGKKNDVVEVSDGYARNCLLKKKLAIEATSTEVNAVKNKLKAEEFHKAEEIKNGKNSPQKSRIPKLSAPLNAEKTERFSAA